jgi:hypothetical protein
LLVAHLEYQISQLSPSHARNAWPAHIRFLLR